jgi:hypothetical protein
MKKIKRLFLIPISAIIIMSFSQCSSAQFDKKAPVTITDAFYKNWVGGIPGVKGVLITIKAKVHETDIIFDSIYFNNKMLILKRNLEISLLIFLIKFHLNFKIMKLLSVILSSQKKDTISFLILKKRTQVITNKFFWHRVWFILKTNIKNCAYESFKITYWFNSNYYHI